MLVGIYSHMMFRGYAYDIHDTCAVLSAATAHTHMYARTGVVSHKFSISRIPARASGRDSLSTLARKQLDSATELKIDSGEVRDGWNVIRHSQIGYGELLRASRRLLDHAVRRITRIVSIFERFRAVR